MPLWLLAALVVGQVASLVVLCAVYRRLVHPRRIPIPLDEYLQETQRLQDMFIANLDLTRKLEHRTANFGPILADQTRATTKLHSELEAFIDRCSYPPKPQRGAPRTPMPGDPSEAITPPKGTRVRRG